MAEIDELRKAILDLHGCDSRHLGSVRIKETFQHLTWDGIVEIFFVINHPEAKEVYAWRNTADNETTTILAISPIESASDAVRAYLASQFQKKNYYKNT
jgi:hypothetical protein